MDCDRPIYKSSGRMHSFLNYIIHISNSVSSSKPLSKSISSQRTLYHGAKLIFVFAKDVKKCLEVRKVIPLCRILHPLSP